MGNRQARGFESSDAAFAHAIREARLRAQRSQEDLADDMRARSFDFAQQTIYKIESGKRKVSIGEAVALSDILGVPLDLMVERNPGSIAGRRLYLEAHAGEILTGLVELAEDTRELRNDLEQFRQEVKEFDEIVGHDLQTWWGTSSTAYSMFHPLLSFAELDGLQWAWDEFRASGSGAWLLRSYKLIPASELPIDGYDEED
ncbi:helix-turn-helix transcriptional regulator [Plantibacter sp. Mn2098]|uniref:helix-turn-helix transcriptional regulator n=1 Tax=Plantibacter sp. Mn2098 TaxID=3395266 RepID=UPI003BC61E26